MSAVWGKASDPPSESVAPQSVSAAWTDEDLVRRISSRDRSALAALFDRYCRTVRGIGFRVLRNRGEAEELVQEVFLFIHEKAHLFDPSRGTAKTWLVQVAYHQALDRRSYLARRHFYDGTDIEQIQDNIHGSADIERDLGTKFSGDQVRKAFDELSERQRVTLELYFFEGLTLREISQQLDEPLANVRHHYYRAIKKLRASAAVANLRKVDSA